MKMEVHYLNSDNNTKKETDERQKRNGSYGRNAGYNTRKQVNRSKNNKYRPQAKQNSRYQEKESGQAAEACIKKFFQKFHE